MSDLTDRMRTCAAFILWANEKGDPTVSRTAVMDAVDLLIEASNALGGNTLIAPGAADLGEPMEIIPPQAPRTETPALPDSPRGCPKCGTHAANTVRRHDNRLLLQCPACGWKWVFRPTAEWV